MKYAWVKNNDDSILEIKDCASDWSPANLDHKFGTKFNVRIIPYVVDADLVHDPKTHKQESNRTITTTEVRIVKSIKPLNIEELAVIADITDRKAKRAKIKEYVVTVQGWIDNDDKTKFNELCQIFLDVVHGLELDK
jgi:hypothetical protein